MHHVIAQLGARHQYLGDWGAREDAISNLWIKVAGVTVIGRIEWMLLERNFLPIFLIRYNMLILEYDRVNGMTLPDAKWEPYVAGLITQANHSTNDITVTLGNSLPFVIVQGYVRNAGISNVVVCFYDLDLKIEVPLDANGDFTSHHTIGDIQYNAAMELF